jgi:phage-related protein
VENANARKGRHLAAIYITAKGQRVTVVRVFVKKTVKMPSREIELALQRAKEVRQ